MLYSIVLDALETTDLIINIDIQRLLNIVLLSNIFKKPLQFIVCCMLMIWTPYDDVIKWKHFPRYWPFVRGIHWSPVNSPHKGQWRWALVLICTWMNGWVNNGEGGLRRHRTHYDVIVMSLRDLMITKVSQAIILATYYMHPVQDMGSHLNISFHTHACILKTKCSR